jgi:nucleotide-binding universal stress UspA family protein
MFDTILICLDGSELSEQSLPYAIEQAVKFQSHIVLLNVVENLIAGTADNKITTSDLDELMKREREKSEKYLKDVSMNLDKRGIHTSAVITEGSAGEAIVEYAKENKVDLICLATHGRSGLERVVLGSVAEYVIRNSKKPILIINPQ